MDEVISLSAESKMWIRRVAFVFATAAVAFSYLGKRLGWLDYRPGGASFDNQIQPIFIVLFVVAAVIALKFEYVGGLLAIFGASALVSLAFKQLDGSHAALVLLSFTVPALLWILVDLDELARNRTAAAVAIGLLVVGAGFFVGRAVYDRSWGPTHPESLVVAPAQSSVSWVWSGAVTSTSASVRAKPNVEFDQTNLILSTSDDLSDPRSISPADPSGEVIGFNFDELEPNTEYFYALEFDGVIDDVRTGQFRTFPDDASSFTFAVGACARVGSNGRVFDEILAQDPLFYLVAGDLHYGDNGRDDVERYQEVMDLTLTRPAQAELYRSVPIAYMWDDHDYGGNDSGGSSPSRNAAMSNYREYVPSYGLSGVESAIYQAFSVGRVRIIMTDARSARDLDDDGGDDGIPSMLGTEQKAWFKKEIVNASEDHALVVWLNPVPWVAESQLLADNWGGYEEERTELADHIANNEIDNLLMISGDAHMVAIDDGTNTDYSTAQSGGFPIFHTAALDRNGSIKGGPYSEGAVDGPGQFGTVEVIDDGDSMEIVLTGLNWSGEELLTYRFSTSE